MNRSCLFCNKWFDAATIGPELYCSDKCQVSGRYVSVEITTLCAICKKGIKHKSGVKRVFCSKECRESAKKIVCLSTGKSGAVKELLVAADLLLKGYDVFRSVSPSSSCDMIILAKGRCLRVEVTTGYVGYGGKVIGVAHDKSKYDVFAVVVADKSIYYEGLEKIT